MSVRKELNMLLIRDLYKENKSQSIKGLNITVNPGSSVSLECNSEISDLLFQLILGKELPSRGEILLGDMPYQDYIRKNPNSVGVILKEDALYEGMTIESYLKFFTEVYGNNGDYKAVMLKLALLDIGKEVIKKLSYSQKRKVSLAREMLKKPALLLIQEPILNLDNEGASLIIENIRKLCDNNTALLLTSVHLKDTILVGDKAYRLEEEGCTEINNNEVPVQNKIIPEDVKNTYTIEKIPAKIEDKILLFDPMEIDYVESGEGSCYLYIRGEKFPCGLSLTELEERLKYFGFFRSHRSYLVNLQRVREVVTWTRNSFSLNLDDKLKSSIPLSKGRLEELKSILKL